MYLDNRQKKLVYQAIEDYKFLKEELDEKIAKDYTLEELIIYLKKYSKDIEITNLESYDDYAYLDFLYKDLNMCVMWETGKGVRVSETYEIYDKERKGYIVEDFLTTEDYVGMLNRTREENLQDLVASLKYFDSKNLQIAYKEQEKKVINFLKENW